MAACTRGNDTAQSAGGVDESKQKALDSPATKMSTLQRNRVQTKQTLLPLVGIPVSRELMNER
jgi:hypothetical protein